MTKKELSGQELRKKIKEAQDKYNLYQISLDEAKQQIEQAIDIINKRAIIIAEKHDRNPSFMKVSNFLNV